MLSTMIQAIQCSIFFLAINHIPVMARAEVSASHPGTSLSVSPSPNRINKKELRNSKKMIVFSCLLFFEIGTGVWVPLPWVQKYHPYTHDKIIDLNAHITIELVLKGNTDVNDDTDDSCWIHPNLFFFGIPDAY